MIRSPRPAALAPRDGSVRRRVSRPLVAGIAAAVTAGVVGGAAAMAFPAGPSDAELVARYNDLYGQSLRVAGSVETVPVTRPDYGATAGIESLSASGTNRDWARMVLLFAGWPQTEDSITVIMRWMRQENYVDSWWLRNNPLNNGWGASGGHFLGGNPTLVDAARDVADALTTYSGYDGIEAAFARAAPSAEIEAAIWASPWATGHYNDGAHWHYTPVEVVRAPASAWG